MDRRRYLRALGPALLLGIGGAYALASWNWCGRWEDTAPSLVSVGAAEGSLQAGAARAVIKVPYPMVAAGYGPPRPEVASASPALEARAVVLEVSPVKVAIVELDLLTVPTEIVDRIRSDLSGQGFAELYVVASHSHSSLGGYDARLVSELAGTGGFRQDAFDAVVAAAEDALRAANATLNPATIAIGQGDASSLVRARSGLDADTAFTRIVIAARGEPSSGAGADKAPAGGVEALDGGSGEAHGPAARADAGSERDGERSATLGIAARTGSGPDGGSSGNAAIETIGKDVAAAHTAADAGRSPERSEETTRSAASSEVLAELWIVAAHPTMVGRKPAELSPDFPGHADDDSGPVTLVLQGAGGNASAVHVDGPNGTAEARFAEALAKLASSVPAPAVANTYLAYSRVSFGVPRPDGSRLAPSFARAASDNLLCTSAPRTSELGALRLGDFVLVTIPGEPTYASAKELTQKSGANRVLSLTNGYLGYVEPTETVKANLGESKRQYFRPELQFVLNDAATLAVRAVKPPAPSPSP